MSDRQTYKHNFLSRLRYRYEVTLGLYMLTTTEKIVLSTPSHPPPTALPLFSKISTLRVASVFGRCVVDGRFHICVVFNFVGCEYVVLLAESCCCYFETYTILPVD